MGKQSYTKRDDMFKALRNHEIKKGTGLIATAKLEQAKIPDSQTANWYLLDAVDIDWNDAELPYTYAVTQTHISDSSDLLHLIDDISHGNAIDWEVYQGEPSNGNS